MGNFGLEGGGDLLLESGSVPLFFEYPWPDSVPGRTDYFLSSAGNDSNNGLSPATAKLTIPGIMALSFGFADVTINIRSNDTFVCAPGVSFSCPAGVSSWLVQGRVDVTAMVDDYPASYPILGSSQPIITAHFNGGSGAVVTGNNTTLRGLQILGDGFSFGVVAVGANVLLEYCNIRSCAIAGGVGVNLDIAGQVTARYCVIGGLNAASMDGTGIFVNYGTYNSKILNCDIGFCGGDPTGNPTQTGFAIHTSGVYDPTNGTTRFAWTYDASGKPTNPNIEIAYCFLHDCAGNLTSGWFGSASLVEFGNGNHQWLHHCKFADIYPRTGWSGGYDMVCFDADINALDSIVECCLCVRAFGSGIEDFSSGSGSWGPTTIRFNLMINNGWGNGGNFGPQGKGTTGTHHIHNNTSVTTLANTGQNPPANVCFFTMDMATLDYSNNIAYTANSGLYQVYADYMPSSSCVSTHNCWYGSGPFYWAGTTYANYAAWAASGANGVDTAGITGDPLFVGTAGSYTPSDYELQSGSPCIGAGVDVFTTFGISRGWEYFNGVAVASGAVNLGCMG